MTEPRRVAVVGCSLAGLRACETLRREGYAGELIVVDAEERPFYDRPPLSKQWLAGTWDTPRIALRPPEALAALELRRVTGHRVEQLELAARQLVLDDGTRLGFDGLVLACGASARTLELAQPGDAVLVLRTLDDARRLRVALAGERDDAQALPAEGRHLVVVGGGFLGLEVAATARGLGAEVTVVETLAAPLARVLGEEIGAAIAILHERHGVRLCLRSGVEALEPPNSEVGGRWRVRLSDGRVLHADAVLVAVGARPEHAWLAGSGLELDDGVVCDEALCAAPGVVVAGDVARVRLPDGTSSRLEHWTNAAEQGLHAAMSLIAGEHAQPFRAVSYFWSDQFETKLQSIGSPDPGGEVVVVDGSLDEGRFVACYGRDGLLVGVVGAGMPRRMMSFRPLLATSTSFRDALASGA
ncbi:MAG TPA: FAD-dependent oxidoreductase [Acidimicrobiales bacterium]|nr:FAD-dependent oxidoreductase [Acidimicrobiales bacterium]